MFPSDPLLSEVLGILNHASSTFVRSCFLIQYFLLLIPDVESGPQASSNALHEGGSHNFS